MPERSPRSPRKLKHVRLPANVEAAVQELADEDETSFNAALNSTLRAGLRALNRQIPAREASS